MSVETVLQRAKAMEVVLEVSGNQIKARGSKEAVLALSPDLKAYKAELLVALAQYATDADERSEQWLVSSGNTKPREVFCSPALTRAEMAARHPGATLVALPPATAPVPSCIDCRYRTPFGNCAVPVEAGITAVFKLVAHPDSGRGCAVFKPKVFVDADTDALISEIAQRLQFSTADVDEMREFAARHPSYAYREFTAWKDRLWKGL